MNIGLVISSPFFWPVMLAYSSAIALLAEWILTRRNRLEKRLGEVRRVRLREEAQRSRLFNDWKRAQENGEKATARWVERLRIFTEQAGLNWSHWWFLQLSLWSAGLTALLVVPLGVGPFWSAMFAWLGLWFPTLFVIHRRGRRIAAMREQLPETFDLMNLAIESGQTIPNAFRFVSAQCGGPIGREFQHCVKQHNLGLPYEITLRDLGRRTGVMELQMFAVALIVQRQAGGDPKEVLKNLAESVRNRMKLAMKVKAITSEGRAQAWVLSALPVVSFVGIYLLDRNYASVLIERPNVLMLITLSVLLGILWIRQIVRVEY